MSLGNALGITLIVSGCMLGACTSFSSPLVVGFIIMGSLAVIFSIADLIMLHQESAASRKCGVEKVSKAYYARECK